jgi:electron transfer flavoprotein alpha subunit
VTAILGLVEHDRGKLEESSLEMLTLGRRLANEVGIPLEAILIGEEARPLAGRVAGFGVKAVHLVHDDRLDEYAPGAWAGSVIQLIEAVGPEALIAPGTDRGTEVMAHVAARRGLPLAANCTEVRPGDPYLVTRQRWGGTLLEEARLAGEVKLLTVAQHVVQPEEAPAAGPLAVNEVAARLADEDFLVRVSERVERAAGKVSLPQARVVVGGGRGVGSAEGFGPLEELADLLGGAVGCSRAVTSAGWRPHADQIGQTGVRIAPELYIACGISGATQHIVGCRGARRILAINTDPDAPLFAQADFAVIGDVHQVVPALVAEIRRARG